MDAIEILMTEHRLIERAIDALIAFADRTAAGGDEPKEELGRFVTFIREFADGHHHGKEEDILFTGMVEAGFPSQGGPIFVMLMEHDQGRAYVRALAELAAQPEPWSAADRERLVEAAHGYGNLLRAHIHKEDAILYPMAEQRLPPELQERISADCAAHDAGKARDHERLHALAGELLARHAPLRQAEEEGEPSARVHHGCC